MGEIVIGITSQQGPVFVVGGTGKTGRRVVERLQAAGRQVRVGSRSGEPPFDWEDPDTWSPALDGMAAAYVTYYPDIAFPGAADRVGALCRLAVEHGVRRLVLLSGRNEPEAQRAERLVEDAGAESTIVRSSFFAQNFSEGAFRESVMSGILAVPAGDVVEPFIDVDDIADIVTAALTEDGHVGHTYEVSGPRLLSFADVAREISAATGHEVEYVPLSTHDFASALLADGLPSDFVTDLTNLFSMVLDGRGAYLSDGVQRALGRAPRDFADYVRTAAANGIWQESVAGV
jgi:uncharacterized protein YbjT (DUF2867 family)